MMSSLHDLLDQRGASTLFVLPDGQEISSESFLRSAETMALRLRDEGLETGDRIIVAAENGEALLRLYVACAFAGIAVCPIDPATPSTRRGGLQRLLQPKLMIDTPKLTDIARGGPSPSAFAVSENPDRDFLILFSSGTTGEPKGIVHTLRSLVNSAHSFAALSGLNRDSVIYHHFPMYYMAGIFNLFLCPVVGGASIVMGPQFSRASMLRFWDLPQQHGVNHLTLTPTMAHSLSAVYRTDDALLTFLGRFEAVISTGSTLYPSVAKKFLDTFGVPLRSCYGITELGGSITLQEWHLAAGVEPCVGNWMPGTDIRADGSAEEPAELLIRTPTMMRGYFSLEGVKPFLDSEGWFRTGDLGYVTDNRLFVTGRTNDLVKKGGEFVSLGAIENCALACPEIAEASAVGIPDDAWGNRIALFIVPKSGTDEASINAALGDVFDRDLRRIEVPDKVVPVPWFPKTSIGKTVKHELLKRYTL